VKVISVNVGLPREVQWHGRTVQTSIWKAPVEGRVRVVEFNLAGDQQSDLSVHGGPAKAVYVYPSEHYDYWRRELAGVDLPWGAFGENLTIEGLIEGDSLVGDALHIGTADFVVTQPRMPCFKLGIRFGDDRMVRKFMDSRRTGFYLAITREGDVGAGDAIELGERGPGVSIADVVARTR
jgi:MOSC domain-containing protein YiiM